MNIFFDSEFTGLHQGTTLISLAMVSETNETFYVEFNDYSIERYDECVEENVIKNLLYSYDKETGHRLFYKLKVFNNSWSSYRAVGNSEDIMHWIKCWLNYLSSQKDSLIFWGDCKDYDWVLFCELFGGALELKVPNTFGLNIIYPYSFDISTIMKMKAIDPDINRENFAFDNEKDMAYFDEHFKDVQTGKHNSLWDALVIQACFHKLQNMQTSIFS